MIACYCRVSSDSQKHESQKEEIRRWLKGNRIKLSEVTWYEDTESGAAAARPGLEAMKKAIFGGEVDTLLADWCERGLRVVSVTEQLDLNGMVGRIVAGVLFGVAEIGSVLIVEMD